MNDFQASFGPADAGRGTRLVAFLIDAFLGVAAYMPWILVDRGAAATATTALGVALFVLLTLFQAVLLTRTGQTLGKRATGIRIVKMSTSENGGFVTNVLIRTALNWALCLIPFYSVVDTLFIFRADRRCLHDHLAGTQVVVK